MGCSAKKAKCGRWPLRGGVWTWCCLGTWNQKLEAGEKVLHCLGVLILIGLKWIWDHTRLGLSCGKWRCSLCAGCVVAHLFFSSLLDKKNFIVTKCVSVFFTLHLGITARKHPCVSFFLSLVSPSLPRPASRVVPPPRNSQSDHSLLWAHGKCAEFIAAAGYGYKMLSPLSPSPINPPPSLCHLL